MGLKTWDSVTAQFHPSPDTIVSEVTPAPHNETEKSDIDVEVQKPTQRVIDQPGVAKVEALQAVWGKHGKYIIIAGSVFLTSQKTVLTPPVWQ
jgi:hypothetical protein